MASKKDSSGDHSGRRRGEGPKTIEKHARIKRLDPEIKAQIDNRIEIGVPIPEVAKWLQREMEQCTDITEGSLVTCLSRYRNDMPAFDVLAKKDPKFVEKAKERVNKSVDELEVLHYAINVQKDRVEAWAQHEETFRVPGQKMSADIDLLARLCVRAHDIKMDLGMGGGRQLGTINIDPEMKERLSKYPPEVRAALSDPESRAKIVSITAQLADRARKDRGEASGDDE